MGKWLVKSEPFKWSWDDQLQAGKKGTYWDGVRNHSAKLHLMAMKIGDEVLFYHSNEGKAVVGVAEVIKEFYPDPSDVSGKFGMVDIRAKKSFKKPVTLQQIKDTPELKDMVLVKNSRLSVQPVEVEEWKRICKMGGI